MRTEHIAPKNTHARHAFSVGGIARPALTSRLPKPAGEDGGTALGDGLHRDGVAAALGLRTPLPGTEPPASAPTQPDTAGTRP
jgi:hypothetical protein